MDPLPSTIQPLPSTTRHELRAGVLLTSPSQLVSELLMNAIDSRASQVVLVWNLHEMIFTVYDNGCGMDANGLSMVGCGGSSVTSKLTAKSSQSESGTGTGSESVIVTPVNCHGWRGEAMNAIGQVCRLEIETRAASDGMNELSPSSADSLRPRKRRRKNVLVSTTAFENGTDATSSRHDSITYKKCIHYGKQVFFGSSSSSQRTTPGTTVTIDELYANMPVRRQMMLHEKTPGHEKDQIKTKLMRLAFIHPEVEFSLYDATIMSSQAPSSSCDKLHSDVLSNSSHLPISSRQRIWLKPRTNSLLENFRLVSTLTGTSTGSPSPTALLSPFLGLESRIGSTDNLFELDKFQVSSSFSAAINYTNALSVSGFLSHPAHLSCLSRENQFIYVNRNFVTYRPLTEALDRMYERLINTISTSPDIGQPFYASYATPLGFIRSPSKSPSQRNWNPQSPTKQSRRKYPKYLLNFELPPEHYDLLYDPDKTTIEFKCMWSITEGMVRGIEEWMISQIRATNSLLLQPPSPRLSTPKSRSQAQLLQPLRQHYNLPRLSLSPYIPSAFSHGKRNVSPSDSPCDFSTGSPVPRSQGQFTKPMRHHPRNSAIQHIIKPPIAPNTTPPFAIQLNRSTLKQFQLIGQLDNKVILIRVNNMILGLDQHAADERRRLEHLQRNLDEYVTSSQLSQPLSLTLNSMEASACETHLVELNAWGWKYRSLNIMVPAFKVAALNHTKKGTSPSSSIRIQLLSIPIICGVELTINDFHEYLSQLHHTTPLTLPIDERTEFPRGPTLSTFLSRVPISIQRVLNSKSCRTAVMFGDPLTPSEMTKIVEGLIECDFPYNCAHGRPTMTPIIQIQGLTPPLKEWDEESIARTSGWINSQLATILQLVSPTK